MEENKKVTSSYIRFVSIVVVCSLCFGMGFLVSDKMSHQDSFEWKKLKTIYSILSDKWFYANQIEDIDSRLVEQAIAGMSYLEEDKHTNYFDLETAKKFSTGLEGSNVGVGFSYYSNHDGNFVITKTFVNSPADKAGLQKGDIVTSVQDMKCSQSDAEDIVAMIKSSDGIELDVHYIRDGKEYTSNMIPTSYDATVSCIIGDGYGIVVLNSFSEYSAIEFDESLQRIKKSGADHLIIDLRDNSGGYLQSVLDIASSLLPEDSTVFIENKADGSQAIQKVSGNYSQIQFDSIVVLQNAGSASASEVLIGALKDVLQDRVKTVGTQSYGKGTEQVSVPFSDGTSIKYTVAEWTTPNGTSINLVGFEPDYEVQLGEVQTVKFMAMEEDDLIKVDEVHVNAAPLQIYLDFLGYTVDRKDEYFSPASSAALAKFQSDHNLESTGNCDFKTWETLKGLVLEEINEHSFELDYPLLKAIDLAK